MRRRLPKAPILQHANALVIPHRIINHHARRAQPIPSSDTAKYPPLVEYGVAQQVIQLGPPVDHLADGSPVILADMGAGSGQITYDWFDKVYPDVADAGIVFTTIGVVTSDPASVESVLAWAARLQNRVAYLIVRWIEAISPESAAQW